MYQKHDSLLQYQQAVTSHTHADYMTTYRVKCNFRFFAAIMCVWSVHIQQLSCISVLQYCVCEQQHLHLGFANVYQDVLTTVATIFDMYKHYYE